MTGTVTSARDLLKLGDADFIGFLSIWETKRQCPLPLVDMLLEWGLESQAEACRWAATEGLRPIWGQKGQSYPYPCSNRGTNDRCYWVVPPLVEAMPYCDYAPEGKLETNVNGSRAREYPTLRDALIGLMDDWQV